MRLSKKSTTQKEKKKTETQVKATTPPTKYTIKAAMGDLLRREFMKQIKAVIAAAAPTKK